MNRAVIVICDSLRTDLITEADAPFLSELAQRSARFANHTSVFPSTTRTSAASIATGCLPARHGLLGNTMAIDEGDGLGCLYNPAGSFGPGRRPLPAEEGLAIAKGAAGDDAATDRFCEEVLGRDAPAVATLWLSEPDYTGHHTPLGSPAHRQAIACADANVRRVAKTVAALDPKGERILFIVGSDHGMETVDDTIDLDGLLVEAGLKGSP